MLYPRHYVLKDITRDMQVDGGGFCDIYRGRHGKYDLCLKVLRVFQRTDTMSKVCVFFAVFLV